MSMLKKVSKRTAQKLFNEGDKIIILPPCKMYPMGAFSLGCRIAGKEYLQKAEEYGPECDLWKGSIERTAWDLMYNNWAFYNTSYECGYYAHYYIEE